MTLTFVRPDGEEFQVESLFIPRIGERITLMWNDEDDKVDPYAWFSGRVDDVWYWWHPEENERIIVSLAEDIYKPHKSPPPIPEY